MDEQTLAEVAAQYAELKVTGTVEDEIGLENIMYEAGYVPTCLGNQVYRFDKADDEEANNE